MREKTKAVSDPRSESRGLRGSMLDSEIKRASAEGIERALQRDGGVGAKSDRKSDPNRETKKGNGRIVREVEELRRGP